MHVRCGNSLVSSDLITSVPYNADRSSGLGIGESPMLNIASQPKAYNSSKPTLTRFNARSFLHDETLTSQTIMTNALKQGGALGGNRCLIPKENCSAWFSIKGGNTYFSTRKSKVMGIASKGDLRTLKLNTGLPKGSNPYFILENYFIWQQSNYSTCTKPLGLVYVSGNAVRKERVTAPLLFKRAYVPGGDTEAKSNVGLKLNKLASRSNLVPNHKIDRELYSLVSSVDMLIYAYENIKSKPGNMTPGVTPETLDGISREKLENLSASLRSEKFSFTASRRIQIPKASGGKRPLSIASPMDKTVQEAMRLVLEAIYEPLFLDNSHGFRPNRSCHTALQKVSQTFQPAQWVIEGDLAKFFDTISHQKLMQLIENKISDRRFTKLI